MESSEPTSEDHLMLLSEDHTEAQSCMDTDGCKIPSDHGEIKSTPTEEPSPELLITELKLLTTDTSSKDSGTLDTFTDSGRKNLEELDKSERASEDQPTLLSRDHIRTLSRAEETG